MSKNPTNMHPTELFAWFTKRLEELQVNLIVFGDFGEDLDDEVTELTYDGIRRSMPAVQFMHAEGTRRLELFELKAVVANLAPAKERARLAKGTLKQLGQPNVPVGVGTDCNNTVGQKGLKLLNIPYMADESEVEPGAPLFIRQLEAADDQSITLVLISGLTDMAAHLREHEALIKSKVKTIAFMGGVTVTKEGTVVVNEQGYMEAEVDAANNKFDLDAAKYVYQRVQELGIPMVVLTRHAAGACQVPRSFYDDLAASGHPVGVKLLNSQKKSIQALWERACLPPDHEDREKLPNRCDKEWFCNTFCGGMGKDRTREDSIWDLIKGFNLYDPMTLIAAIPELRERFFEPVVVVVNGVEHMIIGPAKANSCVKCPKELTEYMVARCIYALERSLEEVKRIAANDRMPSADPALPPTPPPKALNTAATQTSASQPETKKGVITMETTSTAIPYTAEPGIDITVASACVPFQNWLASLQRERFVVKSVHFQSVDMFGPKKVGFVKFKADVADQNGKFIPGIVFMRGGSVGILPILDCCGKEYAILTVQPRIPTGSFTFEELPAGMLDGSDNFAGVAAAEIEQELGMKIKKSDLTDMSAAAGHDKGFYVSPGGTDETLRLFSFRKEVTEAELADINGRCTGLLEEGEQITLKVVPLDYLLSVPDGKTIVAYALYKKAQQK